MTFLRWLLLFTMLSVACSEAAEDTPKGGAGAHTDAAMCAEHGVLEAVCTKCNPALAAVFRAKGDFCEEHGFPESFCPLCHPEKGGRPAADVADDGAPADGLQVRFKSADTAKLAGIQVAPVIARASSASIEVTAKLVYDATKVAQVNARSVGVVRAIQADIGARVQRGAALATIESAEVGASSARLDSARARLQLAEANHTRTAGLLHEGIAPQKDVLAAQSELAAARSELAAAQAAITMVGGVTSPSSYVLRAPIAGVVTQRNATIGHLVSSEDLMFEIVDTSTMWAELDIPESIASRAAIDQTVRLQVDGVADEITGRLSCIAPQIDPHTRTALGRVAVENKVGLLRANMFARAHVQSSGSADGTAVPRAALQRAKTVHVVFVQTGADTFETRRVEVGAGDADLVEVRGRLKAGDMVATEGSFLLKTETLKDSIGAGCCDAEKP